MAAETTRQIGSIVLCGGHSRRMGFDKAELPFGDETMLSRIVRILRTVADPLVVVAACGQQFAKLDEKVAIVDDEFPECGPLGGILTGLEHLKEKTDAAFVISCDVPLLTENFLKFMIEQSQGFEIAIPREGKHLHPLSGVYRTMLLPRVTVLVKEDRLRPLFLIEQSKTNFVETEEIRKIDPNLDSLRNVNTPEEYLAALELAGIPRPDDLSFFDADP